MDYRPFQLYDNYHQRPRTVIDCLFVLKSRHAHVKYVLLVFFSPFLSTLHFAQGESETHARAQGRFRTAPACKEEEASRIQCTEPSVAVSAEGCGGERRELGGVTFRFVILKTTDVNSFLRDLISMDLHGCLIGQHPCGECQFYPRHGCKYRQDKRRKTRENEKK